MEDSKFLDSFEVFHDLDEFIYQKNKLLLVSAFIQIKKHSRKKNLYQRANINRDLSQSNGSAKHGILYKQVQPLYNQKREHFSDIFQGVQNLNQIRKKLQLQNQTKIGLKKNTNLGKSKDQFRDNLSNNQPQYQKNSLKSFNSNKSPNIYIQKKQIKLQRNADKHFTFQMNTPVNTVPRLIGLTSQQQISDIQPFYQGRKVNTKSKNNIVQQQQDDDQFQDMILDRLSKIQENVNRIIQQKKKKQIIRGIVGQPITSKSFGYSKINKVPGYMSGNITPNKQMQSRPGNNSTINIYENLTSRHREEAYNMLGSRLKSNSINSPRVSEGQGNANIAMAMEQNVRRHRVSNQKYFVQRLQKSKSKIEYRDSSASNMQDYQKYGKSKKLGQYRQSESYANQQIRDSNKVKKSNTNCINYYKIRQEGDQLSNFKYIPLSKVKLDSGNQSQKHYTKTERMRPKQLSQRISKEQVFQNFQQQSQRQPNSSSSESQIKYRYVPKNSNPSNFYGHQNKKIQNNYIKSYTQQAPDYVNEHNQIHTHNQISKKLKKLTQKFGHVLQRQTDLQLNGYRSYQTTERIMYPAKSRQSQAQQNQIEYQRQIPVRYKWRREPQQKLKNGCNYTKNNNGEYRQHHQIVSQQISFDPKRKYSSNQFSQSANVNIDKRQIGIQRNLR